MPNPEVKAIIIEYWDVPEQNMERFMYFYENIFYGALTHTPGYIAMTINVRSDEITQLVFGETQGPRKAITYHPFLSQLGTRTDAMIDFDALLKDEWNVLGTHFLGEGVNWENLFPAWIQGFEKIQPNWREENPGITDVTDVLVKDFFSLVNNHWDVFLETKHAFWNDRGGHPPVASVDAALGKR